MHSDQYNTYPAMIISPKNQKRISMIIMHAYL